MRILTLAFAAAFALSFLTLQAEPVQAVGICTYNDTTNNMGGPGSQCTGVACVGYNSQTGWQTCVPDEACDVLECFPPCYYYGCPPPVEEQQSSAAIGPPALCVGTIYNNQAGQPSSGCDGVACTGFSQGDWKTCCPRIEDPCRYLMCQPPFDP